MDVKTTFLNGDLEEEIYMEQPDGYIAPGQESKVCKRVKSLYGLKQAPKQWHHKFDHVMMECGYKINECEKCVYVKNTNDGPDLAFAIIRLSRYTSNPSVEHWKSITRVLRYLRYTRTYGLHYTRYPEVIEGYSDANWTSDVSDSKSTSGFLFTLGGRAVSWKSSKQTVISRSTMESEFIALEKSGEEAEWLHQFLEDILGWHKPVATIFIHCDSQSAIGRAESAMYNDPLTKGLNRESVARTSRGIGLKPMHEKFIAKENPT
ncbi:hypothetical protein L1887_31668 [Cichorium endivia]|nr:hypothetical protein L1887_31668 [Cichorium endivia]